MINNLVTLIECQSSNNFRQFDKEVLKIVESLDAKKHNYLAKYLKGLTYDRNIWLPNGQKHLKALLSELNNLGTEILDLMYSNGFADQKNRNEHINKVIYAGSILEDLKINDLMSVNS